jgi:hypothetical protein
LIAAHACAAEKKGDFLVNLAEVWDYAGGATGSLYSPPPNIFKVLTCESIVVVTEPP